MLRELMEWAALLKLASQGSPKLLIRDGLLRSVLLNEKIFQKLTRKFEELTTKNHHLLVGISKRSRIISYLSVGLGLNRSFSSNIPEYLPIPPELEQEAGPVNYQWVNSRTMGQLFVARLDSGQNVPLMPVDIARWQVDQVDAAMTLLHFSAKGSFPIRGYPQALVEADQHARLGGLEIQLLERLMLEEVADRDPRVAQKARELMLFGKQLAEDFNHEQLP
jgi:hypothetical protein